MKKYNATFTRMVLCLRPEIVLIRDTKERERKIIYLEKEISKKLGISIQAVIFWRNSERVPMSRVVELADIYNKDVYEFLEKDDEND